MTNRRGGCDSRCRGATDLAIGARIVFVMITPFAKDGTPNLLPSLHPSPAPGAWTASTPCRDVRLTPQGPILLETFGTDVDELSGSLGFRLRTTRVPSSTVLAHHEEDGAEDGSSSMFC